MFTGLIEEIGTVTGLRREGEGYLLAVAAEKVLQDMNKGDSVNVNGACQTVTEFTGSGFSVFVSKVTAAVTTLGSLAPQKKVNLERAMSHQSRFGGHIVQGHVDVTGKVSESVRDSSGLKLVVTVDPSHDRYIVSRGSVAVDGVSLTVVEAGKGSFTLYLIPETLGSTTLTDLKRGDIVNIEVDILAKYVEKMMTLDRVKGKEDRDGALKRKLFDEGYGY